MANHSSPTSAAETPFLGPPAPWLGAGFLLAGLGTVLLGPILPYLAHAWTLTDAQSGLLLAAKFVGAFLGGVSVPGRLRWGILAGMVLAGLGFGAFGLSTGLLSGAICLFVSGLGLGLIIASTNILAGRRYREYTGSALASLNFFWSLGAVSCGLIAAVVLPRFQLRGPLLSFAGLFLVAGLGGLTGWFRKPASGATSGDPIQDSDATTHPEALERSLKVVALPRAALLHFATLLLLYGGLETCMTAWLTTYTLRFSDIRMLGGQSALVLLWSALTAGRVLSSIALRFLSERSVQRLGLAFSAIFTAALTTTRHGPLLSLYCVLLGLSLAPFFPTTFALLMRRQPTARQAGFILAVSGLGAALFPWLMGVISTHSGSLRVAMGVPFALAAVLLLLSLSTRPAAPPLRTVQG